jgi:hypothetical protein
MINKSELMRNAWDLAKTAAKVRGEKASMWIAYTLTQAWETYKNATKKPAVVKPVVQEEEVCFHVFASWFTPILRADQRDDLQMYGKTLVGETEKAYKYSVETDTTTFYFFAPKSAVMTQEQVVAKIENIEKREKMYADIIKFAKANGVKGVRVGLRKSTIMDKIRFAGLEIPAELI